MVYKVWYYAHFKNMHLYGLCFRITEYKCIKTFLWMINTILASVYIHGGMGKNLIEKVYTSASNISIRHIDRQRER